MTAATTKNLPDAAVAKQTQIASIKPKLDSVKTLNGTGLIDVNKNNGETGMPHKEQKDLNKTDIKVSTSEGNINRKNNVTNAKDKHEVYKDNSMSEKQQPVTKVDVNIQGDKKNVSIKSVEAKISKDNEVTPGLPEGRADEDEKKKHLLPTEEDRWIWDDGGTITVEKKIKLPQNATGQDLDDRTAFDGSACPSGQVKLKGVDKCVVAD